MADFVEIKLLVIAEAGINVLADVTAINFPVEDTTVLSTPVEASFIIDPVEGEVIEIFTVEEATVLSIPVEAPFIVNAVEGETIEVFPVETVILLVESLIVDGKLLQLFVWQHSIRVLLKNPGWQLAAQDCVTTLAPIE